VCNLGQRNCEFCLIDHPSYLEVSGLSDRQDLPYSCAMATFPTASFLTRSFPALFLNARPSASSLVMISVNESILCVPNTMLRASWGLPIRGSN